MTKMCSILEQPNFKLCLASLRIIHKLLKQYAADICKSGEDFDTLINVLAKKLIDNKVVVRHAVLKIFYLLSNRIGCDIYKVFQFCKASDERTVIEIQRVLIMSCIVSSSSCNLKQASKLRTLCNLADGSRQQVSDAVIETLSIMISKDPSCEKAIKRSISRPTMEKIIQKVDSGNLATLNYEGIVEFPVAMNQTK